MAKGNFIEYVVSDNPNKYPNGGEQNGYYYETVEDVTPEVTAQTPVITQIAENLGVTITTPSGTNKQILQGNNSNLLNIKDNAKKEGAYVWKKLTAEGGDFVDFAVDNDPIAYPDGAVHTDGYWYEKMVEGIPLPSVFTKYAIDKFTYSSKTKANDLNIKHSLGEKPLFAYIFAGTKNLDNYDLFFMAPKWKMTMGSSGIGVAGQAYSITSSIGTSTYVILDSYIECYFKAGVEYTLITMA